MTTFLVAGADASGSVLASRTKRRHAARETLVKP
jgi:hypothetical protein